jgi:hypothetical protein
MRTVSGRKLLMSRALERRQTLSAGLGDEGSDVQSTGRSESDWKIALAFLDEADLRLAAAPAAEQRRPATLRQV